MRPSPDNSLEATLLARERTVAELAIRVTRITAELSDDEVLRLLHSILDARARTRRDPQAPTS